MKKPLFTFLFSLFVAIAFSQAYQPMPTSNAKWCIEYNDHVIPPPPWWYTNYWETSYDGDTVIMDRTYIKISKTEYNIYCLSEIVNGPAYIGAIRDDTAERRVYFVPPGQQDEELIYDFSLMPGDTLYSYLNNYEPVLIASADSVTVGQNTFRRLNFQYQEGCMIEGVGSCTGLLEDIIAFEGGGNLCALYVDSALYYPEDSCYITTDTCLTLNINSLKLGAKYWEVYPNPASDHFVIRSLDDGIISGMDYQFIDVLGNTVLRGTVPGQAAIDISGVSPGIYFLKLINRNRQEACFKVIKR